jgi:ribosome-associated protein
MKHRSGVPSFAGSAFLYFQEARGLCTCTHRGTRDPRNGVSVTMIRITSKISLDEKEIQESFVQSSGPGGQHVNKVSTAVQLRFDVKRSASLPEPVRQRLLEMAGSRLTREGVLLIVARRFRSQDKNRKDARERLVRLIRRAARKPRTRRATRPPSWSLKKRLEDKRKQSEKKRLRGTIRNPQR